MNRNVAFALVAIVLIVGAVLYFGGTGEDTTDLDSDPTSEVTDAGDAAADGAEESTPTSDPEPVGAVAESQQEPGVIYDENGVAVGGVEPRPSGTPLNIDYIIEYHENHTFVSNDGRDTFTVPLPDDPRWPDYLEFRRAFPSMNDNSKGYAIAYDPEWRSVLRGYREVPEPGMELFGGADTLRGLIQRVLDEIEAENDYGLVDLAITKEEFEIICWPSFPQARPYTLAYWTDAWRFQYANILSGIREGKLEAGGRGWDLESIAYDEIEDFQHFRLYNGVKVRAKDRETGEVREFRWVDSVIEKSGTFKVYMYKN